MTMIRERIITLLGLITIAIVTWLVFSPAMTARYIWDDEITLTQNRLLRSPGGLRDIWFSTKPVDYFPLTYTSLWVERRIWGDEPAGYHATNIALHVVTATLLWRVMVLLRVPGAFLIALLFAVHPVNVSSVAWISQRKNTLSMLFAAMTLWAYLRFQSDEQSSSRSRGRWACYFAAIVAFALALLSKTSVVMLPVVLLVLAWWRSGRVTWRDVRLVSPLLALSLVLGLVTVWFQSVRAIGDVAPREDGLAARLVGAGMALGFYAGKIVFPANLAMVYPRWELSPVRASQIFPLIALAVIVVLAWRSRAGWGRPVLAAIAVFVLMLLPVLGFVDMAFARYSLVADHWQYPAMIAIVALIVGMIIRGLPMLGSFAVVSAIITCGFLSNRYTHTFHDQRSLWEHNLTVDEKSWVALTNLGREHANEGDFARALSLYEQALSHKQDEPVTHLNIGQIHFSQRRYREAAASFERAIALLPRYSKAHYNLGLTLAQLGEVPRGVAHLRQALEIDPDSALIHQQLAMALLQMTPPATDEALARLQHAHLLEPALPALQRHLGVLYTRLRRLPDAAAHLGLAVEHEPTSSEAHRTLGIVLIELGEDEPALKHLRQAVELDPESPATRFVLARALQQLGRTYEAAREYEQTLSLARQAGQATLAGQAEQSLRQLNAGRLEPAPAPLP